MEVDLEAVYIFTAFYLKFPIFSYKKNNTLLQHHNIGLIMYLSSAKEFRCYRRRKNMHSKNVIDKIVLFKANQIKIKLHENIFCSSSVYISIVHIEVRVVLLRFYFF